MRMYVGTASLVPDRIINSINQKNNILGVATICLEDNGTLRYIKFHNRRLEILPVHLTEGDYYEFIIDGNVIMKLKDCGQNITLSAIF